MRTEQPTSDSWHSLAWQDAKSWAEAGGVSALRTALVSKVVRHSFLASLVFNVVVIVIVVLLPAAA